MGFAPRGFVCLLERKRLESIVPGRTPAGRGLVVCFDLASFGLAARVCFSHCRHGRSMLVI